MNAYQEVEIVVIGSLMLGLGFTLMLWIAVWLKDRPEVLK
jgi:hypothetical protein